MSMEKLSIQLPVEVKARVEADAGRRNVSMNQIIIEAVCKLYQVPIPPTQRRGKYATAEERYAAEKKNRQARQALIKKLLDENRAQERQAAIQALAKSVKR